MHEKIAILEDDPDILKLLSLNLKEAGFKVRQFSRGGDFFEYILKEIPDLLILDLMLPDIDGLEICKKIREDSRTSQLPVIMLTAKGEETDKVIGLEIGADDYVTKPFSLRELIARIKALLRRKTPPDEDEIIIEICGILKIYPSKYEVYVNGNKIALTATEFNLLQILAEGKGRVFSRDELINKLWSGEKIIFDRTIDVHVKNLRDKLGKAGEFIKSIRGVGYKLER